MQSHSLWKFRSKIFIFFKCSSFHLCSFFFFPVFHIVIYYFLLVFSFPHPSEVQEEISKWDWRSVMNYYSWFVHGFCSFPVSNQSRASCLTTLFKNHITNHMQHQTCGDSMVRSGLISVYIVQGMDQISLILNWKYIKTIDLTSM